MEISQEMLRQLMQTSRVPTRVVSSDIIAQALEENGWVKSIAGDAEFNKAVSAIQAMFSSGRGLLVTGDAGCGKTQLMSAIRDWLNSGTLNWMYCKEPKDVNYMRYDDDAIKGNVFVDDIGCEEIIREYGNIVDVVGDYIQRYHYRGTGRFIATTNLNSQQINERYGARCLDRLLEMCVVLKLNGKTKRERIVYA